MSSAGLVGRRMLNFNLLPSVTLHPSRHAGFAPGNLSDLFVRSDSWQATWHRHWSRQILKQLDLGLVTSFDQAELSIGLLPPAGLSRLALRIGAIVDGPRLQQMIEGSSLRALRDLLGDDLLTFARRHAQHYAMADAPAPRGTIDLSEWELSGNSVILAAISDGEPDVRRRAELKLPTNSLEVPCPVPKARALDLCLRVLKDLDPAWYFSFPAVR